MKIIIPKDAREAILSVLGEQPVMGQGFLRTEVKGQTLYCIQGVMVEAYRRVVGGIAWHRSEWDNIFGVESEYGINAVVAPQKVLAWAGLVIPCKDDDGEEDYMSRQVKVADEFKDDLVRDLGEGDTISIGAMLMALNDSGRSPEFFRSYITTHMS